MAERKTHMHLKEFIDQIKGQADAELAFQHYAMNLQKQYEEETAEASPLKEQVGGNHYKKWAIQPVEYIHANNIPFCEGNAIKYLTRWRDKGGVDDLKKAKHFIDLLIELETRRASDVQGS